MYKNTDYYSISVGKLNEWYPTLHHERQNGGLLNIVDFLQSSLIMDVEIVFECDYRLAYNVIVARRFYV